MLWKNMIMVANVSMKDVPSLHARRRREMAKAAVNILQIK
jgi:hypothetical protein